MKRNNEKDNTFSVTLTIDANAIQEKLMTITKESEIEFIKHCEKTYGKSESMFSVDENGEYEHDEIRASYYAWMNCSSWLIEKILRESTKSEVAG